MTPHVSIVIPTYRERDNLEVLLDRIGAVLEAAPFDGEVLLMDDRSNDGSRELMEEIGPDWAQFVERDGMKSLAAAVIDGLGRARADRLMVMDADLSHPPEAIPDLIAPLDDGAEFVIGSRYVPGGSVDEDWGFLRWINSRGATLLARPFTSARDPMAGLFAIRRDVFERAATLDPIGFKIGLELIVKARCTDVREVPIHFGQRHAGKSKLGLKEQVAYVQHVARLAKWRVTNRRPATADQSST